MTTTNETKAEPTTAPAMATERPPLADGAVERILAAADMPRERALDPRNMDEADRWAERAAESKMYGVTSVADAFMRIATGRELGLSAATSLRLLYVFESKGVKRVGMYAELMHALCLRARDVCEYFYCVDSAQTQATFATKRVGHPEKRLTFTMSDAQAAGLASKDTYKGHPARMLEARCKSALARLEYPDIMGGIYDADEMSDEEERENAATETTAPQSLKSSVAAAAEAARQKKAEPPVDGEAALYLGRLAAIGEGGTGADLKKIAGEMKQRWAEDHPLHGAMAKAYKAAKAGVDARAQAPAAAGAPDPAKDAGGPPATQDGATGAKAEPAGEPAKKMREAGEDDR